jgi:hypothetical protein
MMYIPPDRGQADELAGWLPVAAEAPRGLCGKGEVQAIGTWDLIGRDEPFDRRDNLVLLGRLFEWLSGREVRDSFTVEGEGK